MLNFTGLVTPRQIDKNEYKVIDEILHETGGSHVPIGNIYETIDNSCSIILTGFNKESEKPTPTSFPLQDSFYICYIGCIYNVDKILIKLKNARSNPRGGSTTQQLCEIYYRLGIKGLQELEGQYILFVHDKKRRKVTIVRDRFGRMPFYYVIHNHCLWFSTFLPSLIKHLSLPIEFNPIAIHCYFSLQGVIPPPYTMLCSFNKMPPNSKIEIDFANNSLKQNIIQFAPVYHQTDELEGKDEQAIIKTLKTTLIEDIESYTSRGIHNVWLSGGLDSSLIVAIMSEELGISDIQTISIGFPDGKSPGNEFKYSDYVSKKYKTEHYEYFIDTKTISEKVLQCQECLNEPIMSEDLVGQYLLSEYSAQNSLFNVLTGLGADELWLGYSFLQNMYELSQQNHSVLELCKQTLIENTHEKLKNILQPKWTAKDYTSEYLSNYFFQMNGNSCSKIVQADIELFLIEDVVKRYGDTQRWHSIYSHTPFLNRNMVDLSAKIPVQSKNYSNITKRFLKLIAESYYPQEFVYRPKGHFSVPDIRYGSYIIRDLCREFITTKDKMIKSIVQDNVAKELLHTEAQLSKLDGNLLWQITSLSFWLQSLQKKVI